MGLIEVVARDGAIRWPSRALERGWSTLTSEAAARIDCRGHDLCLVGQGTADARHGATVRRAAARIGLDPGPVTSVAALDGAARRAPAGRAEGASLATFEVGFASGEVDQLALRLGHDGRGPVLGLLLAIWPVLRQDCLKEAAEAPRSATDALLWVVCQRLGAAVLVVDARGRVVQSNAAGAILLAGRTLLREAQGGLAAASAAGGQALQRGVAACLARPSSDGERIVMLHDAERRARVPVSLSRFDGAACEPMVVVIVPSPPDPRRIERLAQALGLTPAEARVAALMQAGLPNREAALRAGLKEQTFNTYAKRVLAKLDVGCRAQVAQMLTWQAGVGTEG